MYEIIVKKDGVEVFSAQTEICNVNEQRAIVPVYKIGQPDVFALVPSNKVNFSITGTKVADIISSEFFTTI